MIKNETLRIRSSKQLIHILDFICAQGLIQKRLADTAIALAYNWNPSQSIYPNQATLAERIQVKDPRTVRTYLSKLRDLCLISYSQPKSNDNQHRPNHYTFHYEALSTLYKKAKQKAAKAKRETQEQAKTHDPAPNDPPITSSFQSEEHKDLDITETAPLVSYSFIEFSKLEALGSELQHNQKLKQRSALNRVRGEKTKRQRLIESLFKDRDQKRRESAAQLQALADERQSQNTAANVERNSLLNSLWSWHRSGNGFTRAMYDRLIEVNRGALNGMDALIAKRFLAS